jgi:hypothetical protein
MIAFRVIIECYPFKMSALFNTDDLLGVIIGQNVSLTKVLDFENPEPTKVTIERVTIED